MLKLVSKLILLLFTISDLTPMTAPTVVITKENIKEQLGFDIKSDDNSKEKIDDENKQDTHEANTQEQEEDELQWQDENRFEGRDIVLSDFYEYFFKLKCYLKLYKNFLTDAEVIQYAKIAYENKFTESHLEHAVFEAYEKVKNKKKDTISKEEMDLTFNGYKNLRIIQENQKERDQNTPEVRAGYYGKKTRDGVNVGIQVGEVVDVVTNPQPTMPRKIIEILVILEDKIIWLGTKVKNRLMPNKKSTSQKNIDLMKKMPAQYCHLEPHLAGNQPSQICSLIRQICDRSYQGPKRSALLLYGPQGTGKTEIAKAIAETFSQKGIKTKFIERAGSSLMNSYQASGANAVIKLFEEAEEILNDDSEGYKMVVIFIDEIDAVGQKREASSNQDVRATLNQFLVELGKNKGKDNIMVIFASNLLEILDPAFLARVEQIHVDLPDVCKLVEIFRFHLEKVDHDYSRKSAQREGALKEYANLVFKAKLSGRDIYNITVSAITKSHEKYLDGVPEEMVFAAINEYVAQKKQIEAKKASPKA